MTIRDLATLISERDECSVQDAMELVTICQSEINDCLIEGRIDVIEDILMDILGIESDYLDVFL